MDEQSYQGLLESIKYLIELEKYELQRVSEVVDHIIRVKYRNVNDIEHVFDRMLDLGFIPEEELKVPYNKLLDYVRPLDSDSADAYSAFFREKYCDEVFVEEPKTLKLTSNK